uniref:Uncharacterized protein n=1 Tax=Anguilla anguilla TaxID=7936 RepID=A0A0E9QPS5_ANGAN
MGVITSPEMPQGGPAYD